MLYVTRHESANHRALKRKLVAQVRVCAGPFPSRPSSLFKFLDVYFSITVKESSVTVIERAKNRPRDMRFFFRETIA